LNLTHCLVRTLHPANASLEPPAYGLPVCSALTNQ
jgi:hypothetical protein